MKINIQKQGVRLIQMLVGILLALNVQAHPHSWVDLKTTIEGDKNAITGFNMSWTFDAMTSFYMLDGKPLSEENREEVLKEVTDKVMDNLVLEHYFTYFYDDETPIPYLSSLEGKLTQDKTQLILDFFIPLGVPQKISNKPLKLQVYEKSYFVDISWREVTDIKLSPELAKYCSLQLIEPNPTPQQVGYAMSLPADATPDQELGQLFTQSVILQCTTPEEE